MEYPARAQCAYIFMDNSSEHSNYSMLPFIKTRVLKCPLRICVDEIQLVGKKAGGRCPAGVPWWATGRTLAFAVAGGLSVVMKHSQVQSRPGHEHYCASEVQ